MNFKMIIIGYMIQNRYQIQFEKNENKSNTHRMIS